MKHQLCCACSIIFNFKILKQSNSNRVIKSDGEIFFVSVCKKNKIHFIFVQKYMSFEYYNDDAYLSSQDGGIENFDDEVLFNEVQDANGKLNTAYQPDEINIKYNGKVHYQP